MAHNESLVSKQAKGTEELGAQTNGNVATKSADFIFLARRDAVYGESRLSSSNRLLFERKVESKLKLSGVFGL